MKSVRLVRSLSSRLRREQPLEADEDAAQGAELSPTRAHPAREEAVLHRVHAPGPVADDLHQDVGLVAQQVRERLGGGAESLPLANRFAETVDRPQRLGAGADHEPPPHAQVHRGGVGGVEREVEEHVVDHGDQAVPGLLHARRSGFLVQRLVEDLGQVEVLPHEALGGGVGHVEMQPEEALVLGRRREPARSRVAVRRPARPRALEGVGADEPVLVRPVRRLGDLHRDGHWRAQGEPRKKSW
jgi:hypothetical protein